jgi:hypothetical protein
MGGVEAGHTCQPLVLQQLTTQGLIRTSRCWVRRPLYLPTSLLLSPTVACWPEPCLGHFRGKSAKAPRRPAPRPRPPSWAQGLCSGSSPQGDLTWSPGKSLPGPRDQAPVYIGHNIWPSLTAGTREDVAIHGVAVIPPLVTPGSHWPPIQES